jgi:hypothetical protein
MTRTIPEAPVSDVPLLQAYQDWFCPSCKKEDRTPPVPANGSRFHPCPKMHGLSTPMVRAGADCRHEAVLRQDYVNGELVQTAPEDGRPYMSLLTLYADGRNDAVVYAPTARATIGG